MTAPEADRSSHRIDELATVILIVGLLDVAFAILRDGRANRRQEVVPSFAIWAGIEQGATT